MLNWELQVKLVNIIEDGDDVACKIHDLRTGCDNCDEYATCEPNHKACKVCILDSLAWLAESAETEIDWSKVPIDTPIYVRDNEVDPWLPRHFSGTTLDNRIGAFIHGKTSFTVLDVDKDINFWIEAKLRDEEKI